MSERIMVVEDDRELRDLLLDVLRDAGYEAAPFPTADAALRAVGEGETSDLVLTDLIMPGRPGQELLHELRARRPELNVIIMTAFGSIESAIELTKAGAFDYLTKPVATDDLLLAVERALTESRHRREAARLARSAAVGAPTGFVGVSPPMQALYRLLSRAAQSPHPVLITGESGTGKELVARALHTLSGRSAFVPVDCGALPENLLESELFGHERGAFTGADRSKEGLFEVADGGTLLLDEIGELPLALQPKLLRALEHSEIRRVGATAGRSVDVRVVAATNRNLESEVELGRFREDLLWRLNVLTVQVPPLRERLADLPLLADYFLARAAGEGRIPSREREQAPGAPGGPRAIAPEAMALLCAYSWPGNVRELRNTILRAATLAEGPDILPQDLPARIRDAPDAEAYVASAARRRLSLQEVERLYILDVLRQTSGNRTRAAEILGLDRKTVQRKLDEYRADDPSLEI